MRCLCVDGGGIRSIASVAFLNQLVQDRIEYDPNFNLYNAFDVFSGTSAGSFVAMSIGVMQMDITKIIDLFCSGLAEKVFATPSFSGNLLTPKYSSSNLQEMLQIYFGTTKLSSAAKAVIVPAYNLTKRDLTIFDSSSKEHSEFTCVEVALASSAAPCLFPSVEAKEEWFIDGGIVANNPSLITLGLCQQKHEGKVKILSVGTGRFIPVLDGKATCSWGAMQWAGNGIFHIIHDGEQIANVAKKIMGADFLRINSMVPEQVSATDNNSVLNIAQLVKIGKSWYWDNKAEIWEWFGWESS